MCLPLDDYPYYVYGGGGRKWNRATRGNKRAPRDVSIDFKLAPPPLRNPEYGKNIFFAISHLKI